VPAAIASASCAILTAIGSSSSNAPTDREPPSGPFRIVADEAREAAEDLLFMPTATAADWAAVFACAEVVRVPAGLAVVQAGEADRALYLITEGTLGVRLPRSESAFKEIEAPAVVGELAFFDWRPRSATLEAITEIEAARLDAGGFARLAAAEPELARAMLFDLGRILALRLRVAGDVIAGLGT
jgi:CRP/FNR family transcriptional regulator, cyclic AMP receptor protein